MNLTNLISEPFSSLSHFFGAVLFSILGVLLLSKLMHDRQRFAFMSVFVGATILLMTLSGIYHSIEPGTEAREFWVRLDVSAIFLLIASSFTFLHGCLFTGWRRWSILALVWSIAIVGIFITATYEHESVKFVTRFVFLGMGWIGLASVVFLVRQYGWKVAESVFLGGCIYTIGAMIDGLKWPVLIPNVFGSHEILHLMVLLGVGSFWYLAFQIANEKIYPKLLPAPIEVPAETGSDLHSDSTRHLRVDCQGNEQSQPNFSDRSKMSGEHLNSKETTCAGR